MTRGAFHLFRRGMSLKFHTSASDVRDEDLDRVFACFKGWYIRSSISAAAVCLLLASDCIYGLLGRHLTGGICAMRRPWCTYPTAWGFNDALWALRIHIDRVDKKPRKSSPIERHPAAAAVDMKKLKSESGHCEVMINVTGHNINIYVSPVGHYNPVA